MMNLNGKDFVHVNGGVSRLSYQLNIATYLIMKNPINTLFYPETYPILLGLFYVGYKYKTKESTIGN